MVLKLDEAIFENSKDLKNPNILIDEKNATIVANMLNKIKNTENIEKIQNNQDRLIQIDKYYLNKYKTQSDILKKVIFFCCVGLVGAVLYNKKLISTLVFSIYLGVVFSILIILIAKDVFSVFLRDNMNFDEYDYGFLYKPPVVTSNMHNDYNTAELSNMPTCAS